MSQVTQDNDWGNLYYSGVQNSGTTASFLISECMKDDAFLYWRLIKKQMRVFDIYQHPKYGKQAVRRGFSWLAFLAPSVWAVRRGLGLVTVMLVVTTTLMFDIAQLAGSWVSGPVAQLVSTDRAGHRLRSQTRI